MIILTHRGLEPGKSNFYPESSYEAFRDQLKRGFGIEFDPNFVKDGIVVSHDSSLKRITNGKDERDFQDVTSEEATSFRYSTQNGDGSLTQEGRVPTLDEVLELIQGTTSKINALHLKGKFQEKEMLDRLIFVSSNYVEILERILIFDVKPEVAQYIRKQLGNLVHGDQSKIHIASSVAHPYDIKRFNHAVSGTLISVEEAISYRQNGLYDWVWLDEWDLKDESNGQKTLYNTEVFEKLKQVDYKIALVTPELHGTSPGLLGGEKHTDASTEEKLFERIKQIIELAPDAICTDYPNGVCALRSTA